jgi:predicted ATPase
MHRLKDLSRPEHVYQLDHPDLAAEFPSLRSLEWYRGNLPHRLTAFIGRESDIAQVGSLVASHRLVTLAGTGGVGKTSLAVRAAAEMIEGFGDGVWLVELAALTDGSQIPGAVAGVFGVEASPSQDLTAVLARHLAPLETLLILDNCEHVIDGAARFVDTLLRATVDVRVLATSREPLRIDGEAMLRVPSLQVPSADAAFDDFVGVEAVALFVDRARLVRPGFAVDDTNAGAVIEICRRLDGIPLAIELAAARLDTMTVTRVTECLDDRFRVLTKGSRAALARQQTLEALIDWSHDLLDEPAQILLRRLGVFGGSFTVDATEQVCGYDPLEPPRIIDRLDRLVETSLVMSPDAPSMRYRMLETIRAYARHHLDLIDETEETMRRLAVYLLEAGPATCDGVPQGDYVEWLRWRTEEQDNYRAALEWACAANDGPLCGSLAVEFYAYLVASSLVDEADAWVDCALGLVGEEPTPLRLRLLGKLLLSAANFGNTSRVRTLSGIIRSDAEALGDDVAAARALSFEADIVAWEGDLESGLALITEAAERLLAAGDVAFESTVVVGIEILSALGRYDEAEAMVDRLESERTSLHGETAGSYRARAFRGTVANYRGDYDRAAELFRSCVEAAREVGPLEHGAMLIQQGRAEFGRHNYPIAHELLSEGFSLWPDDSGSIAIWFQTVPALIKLETQGLHAAAPCLREALAIAAAPDCVLDREEALTAIGEAALAAGEAGEAAVFHAAAIAARERIPGLVPDQWTRTSHDRTMEQLQQTLQSEDLQQLIDEGRSLTYEEAAERARTFLDEILDRRPAGSA